MKKFLKICGIMALTMCVMGIVIASVAGRLEGRKKIHDTVSQVTDGRVGIFSDDLKNWGIHFGEGIQDRVGEVHYELDDNFQFSSKYPIYNGDVERYSLGAASDVKAIDFSAGGCTFETKKSKDDQIYVEAEHAGAFQAYINDGILFVIESTNSKPWSETGKDKVTVYLPEDFRCEEIKIMLGAGCMELRNLCAKDVDIRVGAGEVKMKGLEADEATLEVGLGHLEVKDMDIVTLEANVNMGAMDLDGTLHGDADLECSMGSLELKLDGDETDFNYDLEGSMCEIQVGGHSLEGFASEKEIDNGADKTITVSGSMGSTMIKF